jgi:hypothetical protein
MPLECPKCKSDDVTKKYEKTGCEYPKPMTVYACNECGCLFDKETGHEFCKEFVDDLPMIEQTFKENKEVLDHFAKKEPIHIQGAICNLVEEVKKLPRFKRFPTHCCRKWRFGYKLKNVVFYDYTANFCKKGKGCKTMKEENKPELDSCKTCKNKSKLWDRIKSKIKYFLRRDDQILGRCHVLTNDDVLYLKNDGETICEDEYDWNGRCWNCYQSNGLKDITEEVKKEYEALGDNDYTTGKIIYYCPECKEEMESYEL